jgi:hypothetical protein
VRLPLIRKGNDGPPIAWWEWLFYPLLVVVVFVVMCVVCCVAPVYFTVYPERHAHEYDFGTEREQEVMRRYRRFASRVSFWRRCGRAVTFPFRRRRPHLH